MKDRASVAAVLADLLILAVGLGAAEAAEGGNLVWAKRAGGTDLDSGQGVAALSDGSVLVTGYFEGTATFGPGEANQTSLSSAGGHDIFLAKYNSNGTLASARRAGGTSWDWGNAVAGLSDGSAVVTGSFAGVATFGPGEANQTSLTSSGRFDIFLAKYNPDGTLAWAKRAGGASNDVGQGVAALSDGSALVTGGFKGTANFGPGEANQTSLTSAGKDDIFLAKYNPDGSLAWAKRAGGTSDHHVRGVAALPDGSAVVTGMFWTTATFRLGEANRTFRVSVGTYDIFLAKYNPNGTLAWAKGAGGKEPGQTTGDSGTGVAALLDGSALVTGSFVGVATFGPGEANQTRLASAGKDDVFLAKYNPDGTLAWAKRAGGGGYDTGYAVAALSDGSALVTGSSGGVATFGPGEANQTSLTSAGDFDRFLAKYNPNGTLAWAKRGGGAAVAALSDGSALVTGGFRGALRFGPGPANQTSLTSAGDSDIFIAKFGP